MAQKVRLSDVKHLRESINSPSLNAIAGHRNSGKTHGRSLASGAAGVINNGTVSSREVGGAIK
jgi:hypothetical protein